MQVGVREFGLAVEGLIVKFPELTLLARAVGPEGHNAGPLMHVALHAGIAGLIEGEINKDQFHLVPDVPQDRFQVERRQFAIRAFEIAELGDHDLGIGIPPIRSALGVQGNRRLLLEILHVLPDFRIGNLLGARFRGGVQEESSNAENDDDINNFSQAKGGS